MKLADYIGIPFKARGRTRAGLDCYGLVCLIYEEVYGIRLPTYEGAYRNHLDSRIPALVLDARETAVWTRVPHGTPCYQGDVLVFRIRGNPTHVGMAINNTTMIHADVKCGVVREDFRTPIWAPRIMSRHRYRGVLHGSIR